VVQISSFNWVDIIIVTIIALSAIFGLWRGLVKEVFSLVTWVAALIVARVYSVSLAPLFATTFEGETTRYIVAFVVLFLLTMVVGTLVSHLLSKLLTIAGLKLTDRILGGGFGVLRGTILVMLVIFVAGGFFASTPTWQQSRLIPVGISLIEWSKIFISDISYFEQLTNRSNGSNVVGQ